ncbi:DNA-binding response regulator [Paenibacillus montaniterrae]|uniref:DNA-binding response regulator n=1 Tax=Paenibacillus montaniterrae TaxID=429341 RepID=A0A920CZT9_9BACL|nr:response regulator [Paenibacillus montaniterrae]GIP17319.1 DNA-binding response regulator [Paenibacillus montaniterrae]
MYHILVAEDEPWIRNSVVEMVSRIGEGKFTVSEATNGEEAWALIQELWPTVLITDIMMPKLDGLSLIHNIHEQGIPMSFIIISGYDNFQYAQKAMRYGVTEYLLKPVDIEQLQAALQRTEESIGRLKDINSYMSRFQQLVDCFGEMSPQTAARKLTDIIDSVLKLKYINPAARLNLLRMFDRKLIGIMEQLSLERPVPSIPMEAEDSVIIRYFNQLADIVMVHLSKHALSNSNHIIKRVCEYIHSHYKKDISLTEMAQFSNMSISYFSAWFKRCTGRTLVQYIQEVRVEKAKQLLLETQLKNYEIAERVGFATQPYFIRVFKNSVGVSPNAFRKRMGL